MNNFGVGYAEDLKNGCNSHGEAIILNPSRRDTTIIHYSIFIIHSNSCLSLNRAINRNLKDGYFMSFGNFILTKCAGEAIIHLYKPMKRE